MKKLLILAILLMCTFILPVRAKAVEAGTETEAPQMDKLRRALPGEAEEIIGDLSPTGTEMGQEGIGALYAKLKGSFADIFGQALRSGLKILAVIIIGSLACAALDEGGVKEAVNMCSAVAVSAIAVYDVKTFFGLGQQTLYSLSDYSRVLLPSLCAAAAGAGAISSASVKFAATALFMDVLLSVGINVILPIIGLYLACVVSSAVLGRDTLDGVAKMLKWAATTALTLLMMGFTAYLGFSGLVAGKTDEMAARLTKSAISTFLPVVGGIVSDAAGTVVAGAGILRNAIGIFGFLAVTAVCLSPFLTIGANYLVYKGTAAMSQALADKRMTQLVDGVGTAMGLVLALVGSGCIMLFISVISSMRAVTGT